MYMVANTSTKKVTINDLNLIINSKQVIDLHRLRLQIDPLDSADLKAAVRKGKIKELNRPGKRSKAPAPPSSSVKKNDNSELLKQIRNLIRQEIGKVSSQPTPAPQTMEPGISGEDFLGALSEISQEIRDIREQRLEIRPKDAEQTLSDLDEDTLTEIHARAVEKSVNKAEGSVSYHEEEVEDSSLIDHVSELEGLQ